MTAHATHGGLCATDGQHPPDREDDGSNAQTDDENANPTGAATILTATAPILEGNGQDRD